MYKRQLTALAAAGLTGVAGLVRAGGGTNGRPEHRVVAAWDDALGRHFIGVLRLIAEQVIVQASIEVPTRAHDLVVEPGGTVLAVARRPGEWLLRWQPNAGADRVQWHWVEDDFRLNGHVVVSRDGASLLTTQTDQQTGAGQLVRRDRKSMAATQRWPTQGRDPHAMVYLPDGQLLVANGGVATLPETGRMAREPDRMDSSLVAMSDQDGRLFHAWRLEDRRLSLRHLAWHGSGRVAVAMQAHHDDPAQRDSAPVLAVLDVKRSELRVAPASSGMGGYAGDVASVDGRWFVSCPRSDAVLRLSLDGTQSRRIALGDACALASSADQAWGWVSGRAAGLQLGRSPPSTLSCLGLKPDNHAAVL